MALRHVISECYFEHFVDLCFWNSDVIRGGDGLDHFGYGYIVFRVGEHCVAPVDKSGNFAVMHQDIVRV
jgi:hypothetical protein